MVIEERQSRTWRSEALSERLVDCRRGGSLGEVGWSRRERVPEGVRVSEVRQCARQHEALGGLRRVEDNVSSQARCRVVAEPRDLVTEVCLQNQTSLKNGAYASHVLICASIVSLNAFEGIFPIKSPDSLSSTSFGPVGCVPLRFKFL